MKFLVSYVRVSWYINRFLERILAGSKLNCCSKRETVILFSKLTISN